MYEVHFLTSDLAWSDPVRITGDIPDNFQDPMVIRKDGAAPAHRSGRLRSTHSRHVLYWATSGLSDDGYAGLTPILNHWAQMEGPFLARLPNGGWRLIRDNSG